jgi:inner membrane protein
VIFVALVGGLVAPWLFGLINAEVGAKRETFRGAGWAQAALLAVLCVWTWRFVEQQKALAMARGMDLSALRPVGSDAEAAERVSASPYPVNPYEWHVVVEAQDFYQVGEADAWRGEMADAKPSDLIYKGGSTLATLKAKQSRLGRAYLDWSQFPVVSDMAVVDRDPRDPEVMWVVTFRDLRFAYRVPFMRSKETPITGKVYLNDNREVVREEMNGKSEP